MPKMKTHKGTAKRFKKTGSGKWVRPKAWRGHHLEIKSSRRTRRYAGKANAADVHTAQLERLLPYANKGK
jgi:large subunit ribosomal protein L35